MSIHFSRSLRALEADNPRRSLISLIVICAFLGAWAIWFAVDRVAVYATSGNARLEVDRENHPVDAPVAGRVVGAPPLMGRTVKAGDILVELDANVERLARKEQDARLAPVALQLASLKAQLGAGEQAMDQERRSAQAAQTEAEARVEQTASAARLAADEARRVARLRENGLVSELDVLRAKDAADERASEARSAEATVRRSARDLDAHEQDRLAQLARLRGEIASLEGTVGGSQAASERLGYEIAQREVRAPISGTLAEVSSLRVGSMVAAGDRICTIVPDGTLRVVALFAPSVALGRIHAGQAARVRLEGFPWTQYGSASAHVSSVAGELRDAQVRVELTLDERQAAVIPFQHGLPAEVDVEIEHVSPFTMVLRSVGRRTLVNAQTQP